MDIKTFYKWFNSQSTLLKVILLVIPFVGWVVELLVRGSRAYDKKDTLSIVMLVLFLVVGWGCVLNLIDIIYMVMTGHLILADD